MPKYDSEDKSYLSFEESDTESNKRRLARSAILPSQSQGTITTTAATTTTSTTTTNAPELDTSSSNRKVFVNLRLDIGSSLEALFATTTSPTTFSSIFSDSSPIFDFSSESTSSQTEKSPKEQDESTDASTNANSGKASSPSAIFSPSVLTDDSTPIISVEEVSELGSDSPLVESTKSPSDINQAPLVDDAAGASITTTTSPVSASSIATDLPLGVRGDENLNSSDNSANLEQVKSHWETNVTQTQTKLSNVNRTKETQEISSSTSTLPTVIPIESEIFTSSSIPTNEKENKMSSTEMNNPSNVIVNVSQSHSSSQQLTLNSVMVSENDHKLTQITNGNTSSAIVYSKNSPSVNDEKVNKYGSNLGTMETNVNINQTKMATSVSRENGYKGHNPPSAAYTSSVPIALALSPLYNNNNNKSNNNNFTSHNSLPDLSTKSSGSILPSTDGEKQSSSSFAAQSTSSSSAASMTNSSNDETMTTPATVNNQTPKSPSAAAVEVITTDVTLSLNKQTSFPSSNGTLTATNSNYGSTKLSNTQGTLIQPLGPLDESSKLTLVELASTAPSETTVKEGDSSTKNDESNSNNQGSILTSNDGASSASSLPLVGNVKTSPNGPLDSHDGQQDSYNFKPVSTDDSVNDKKVDSFKESIQPSSSSSAAAVASTSTSSSSSSSPKPLPDHFSLWETMVQCRNINSAKVIADVLKNMKGYHFDFIVFDTVELPTPFPMSLFNGFSFEFLEIMNITSIQFHNNFQEYANIHARSGRRRDSTPQNSSSKVNNSNSSSTKSDKSRAVFSSTSSLWKK